MSRPWVKLGELRKIGWVVWNPIGLSEPVGPALAQGAADEYDAYLLRAFGMCQSGKSQVEIAVYLDEIAFQYMGLSRSAAQKRANHDTAMELMRLADSLT